MKKHLFILTIGPVQSFIAQARKVHDLHSGSKLLSNLCREAANHFENEYKGEIIFPYIQSDSIPNRFLGKITTDKDLSEIGKSISDVVKYEWKRLFDELVAAPLEISGSVYQDALRQIGQHLDIQWLFHPLDNDSDAFYRTAYVELNKNLIALKNSRPFFTTHESGRKCSLDGERNVIFYRKTESQTKENKEVQTGSPLFSETNVVFNSTPEKGSIFQLRHLQPGEGLSAVSMLKRIQDFEAGDFPDTAQFALAETVRAIGTGYLTEMSSLFQYDSPKYFNWQLLFEDNLNVKYFEKQGLAISKLEEACEIQRKFAGAAQEKGRKLEKYYALVIFDGDHMGEWWKGVRLKPHVSLEDFHHDLSKKLANFATKVRERYPEDGYEGWVIYAGGDDFLGFFNLHHLTDAINFLRKTYKEIVCDGLSDQIAENHKLTFSAGVCISHYKEPLSLVLGQARELESSAKKLRGKKDAIGIGVIPGSGQTASVVLPFEAFPNVGYIISNLQSNNFSNAFVSKARIELELFANNEGELGDTLKDTAKSLLDRAVNRACNLIVSDEDSKKEKEEKVNLLQMAVKNLFDLPYLKLNSFFNALDIADFIERQTHISLPKTENVEV